MSTNDPDIPDGPSAQKKPLDKKAQNSFLALGIVFLAVGIGMSFSDSSLWVAFLVLGLAFLGVAAASRAKKSDETPKGPPSD